MISRMADLLIRNVPQRTVNSLKAQARRHRRSVQAEVLDILETANVTAGDRMIGWLESHSEPGLSSEPGICVIRETRDTR